MNSNGSWRAAFIALYFIISLIPVLGHAEPEVLIHYDDEPLVLPLSKFVLAWRMISTGVI